jgi:small GTP-binding protein
MAETFDYDVFLSHAAEDKPIARAAAERLRADGLRVWFDEWEITPSDNIPAKVEEGLENSRILVLCMSANAFGSDWARLESYTFRFRDPLNKDRRFIPLRLDDTPIKGSMAQFLYIEWLPEDYVKLLDACRPPARPSAETPATKDEFQVRVLSFGHTQAVRSVAYGPDSRHALSGSRDKIILLWNLEGGHCLRVLEGHTDTVVSVAWSADGEQAASGSWDKTVRLWEARTGKCLRVLEGHTDSVVSVAWSANGEQALSGSEDKTVRLWDARTGKCLRVLEGHTDGVLSVSWSTDGQLALSGSADKTVRLWNARTGKCLGVLEGHTSSVWSVSWSADGQLALSGSADKTVRLWEARTGKCLGALEGHTGSVWSVVWSPDGEHALSGSWDKTVRLWEPRTGRCLRVLEGHTDRVYCVAWSVDGEHALSCSEDKTVRLWETRTGKCLRVFEGHTSNVHTMAWSADGEQAISGSEDRTVRLWEARRSQCALEGHTNSVASVAWSTDGGKAISGSWDKTVRLWEAHTGKCLRVLEGHADRVYSVAWSPNGAQALSGSKDRTVRLWDLHTGKCVRVLEGHTDTIGSVAWSADSEHALSGSWDKTVRLWEARSGKCLRVLEGHTDRVDSVAWSADGKHALSGSWDKTVRLWEAHTGKCLRVLEGHTDRVLSLAWLADGQQAFSGSADGTVRLWETRTGKCLRVLEAHHTSVVSVASLSDERAFSGSANGVWREWDVRRIRALATLGPVASRDIQYTNAKVLLVGDSGVGKTGLSNRLALQRFEETESTDGAWATHWPLRHAKEEDGVDREIWLWDFAGQVDYRLVHQLFMDDTAAAVLVFNPQNENPFEGLGHWDRDLQKAARKPFAKLLAAGRIDRGGLVVSAASMKKFMAERGFLEPLHLTSAKTAAGCSELRDAIDKAIDWQNIPTTTSPALYYRMKQEILNLRDRGLVLIRLVELKQRMELTLSGESFQLAELEAVVSLLSGPGMIQQLDFGGFILLRPEVLSRYAAAVVRKVRQHPQEMGCIGEEQLLAGDLDYQDFTRLPREDETVVLRALLETLVSRAWCLRQPTDGSAMLTFPSYFRRERKDQPGHPTVLMTYRFDGPTDEIYATLVVRLHHAVAFKSTALWKSAADFRTDAGAGLGFTLAREGEGTSLLEVYFAADVDLNSRLLFLRYIHDHLVQHARNVKRLRQYYCSNKKCDTTDQPFADQSKIEKARLPNGKGKVFCPECGKPILLLDAIEQRFESSKVKQESRELATASASEIDNESRELILVGHAYAIVAEAGQIYRGYTNSDHGIDGEIEFKDDQGRASGNRLYLQLKSGDSYLTERHRDKAEVFQIKNPRWADYWRQQAYTVMLVIRTSDGHIRWMDVTAYLKRESGAGKKPLKQIVFDGERFDMMSVRRWRERILKHPPGRLNE